MKKETDDVAGGEQAFDRIAGGVEHLRAFIDLQAAKRKRDSSGDGVGPEWRRIDGIGPVGFSRRDAFCASAIQLGGIERNVFAY